MQKAGSVVYDVSLKGRRVVISTDGGRIRIRKNKRGKKTNKGRNRFWKEQSAEAILLLRSYYKAGRWNLLKQMAISSESIIAA